MYNPDLRKYFQTSREVVLPGIKERIMLPRDVWFRYDGEVRSLSGNIARTELIIRGLIELDRTRLEHVLDWPIDSFAIFVGQSEVRARIPLIEDTAACCAHHQIDSDATLGDGPQAYVIAKKRELGVPGSIFADGHESGEFLQRIRRQLFMQDALNKAGVKLNALAYHGEDFADIGGLLALRKVFATNLMNQLPTFKHREPVLPEQVDAFLR